MNAEETICRAISNRRRLEFKCGGERCIAEPHQLGLDSDGHLVLLAYLVVGPTEPEGAGQRWKVYRVSDFEWALESTDTFTGPRPGYEPAPNNFIASAVLEL